MRRLRDLWFRLRALWGRAAMERELDEEFAFHLQKEAEKYQAGGLGEEEARRRARVKFGGEERFKEKARESWGVSPVIDLRDDLRFAARQLWRNPAFSTLAALTLSLGIGGTVALFSVVNGLMLRPLPVPDEDRVVAFWSDYNWRGAEFDLIKDVPEHFESVAAFSNSAYTLRTGAGSTLVLATVASVELFDVLRAAPLFGRAFDPGEDRAGAEPVVILSHSIWEREFASDRTIVGGRINLGGVQRTVVGVMPEGFYFPTPEMELFVPLDLDPARSDYANNGWLVLAGRLGDSATDVQVAQDLQAITAVLGDRYSYSTQFDKTRDPYVTPLRTYLLGDVRPAVLLLFAAVGVILLMACVNVTALILTKTVDRTREMSVRAALGAGRARLAKQVLTESIVLGLVAGAIGMALATALFDVLVTRLPLDPAFQRTLSLDWVTLVSALALAVVSGGLTALAPMRSLLRGDLSGGALGDRSPGSRPERVGRMQDVLVFAQVMLAVVLVTGASLLVRTVGELRSVDPGFDPEGVLTLDLLLPQQETTSDERTIFFSQLIERAGALPGVSAAGLINRLPLRDGGYQGSVRIDDRPDLEGANRPNAMYRPVTPEAFGVLGVQLIEGRGIEQSDLAGGPVVAVINQSFARRIWGDQSPIGRTFTRGSLGRVEVVGVIRDMAVSDLIGEQPMAGYYAWDQAMRGQGLGILLVKGAGEPSSLAGPLRAIVHDLEPRAAIGRVETMDDVLDGEISEALRLRFFLGLFSLLGIVLGAVGIYGVVSYSVHRRQAEFGLRMALGAGPRLLLGTVVRRGMLPVVLGVIGGTAVGLVTSKALASFLYQIAPSDPVSVLVAAGALLMVGGGAALGPAMRASRTDPAVALRKE